MRYGSAKRHSSSGSVQWSSRHWRNSRSSGLVPLADLEELRGEALLRVLAGDGQRLWREEQLDGAGLERESTHRQPHLEGAW